MVGKTWKSKLIKFREKNPNLLLKLQHITSSYFFHDLLSTDVCRLTCWPRSPFLIDLFPFLALIIKYYSSMVSLSIWIQPATVFVVWELVTTSTKAFQKAGLTASFHFPTLHYTSLFCTFIQKIAWAVSYIRFHYLYSSV